MSDALTSVLGSSLMHEVSLFINSESFVGRELARRIVLRCSDFRLEDSDHDKSDESDFLYLLLRQSCCVRFFTWLETTYVPSYLSRPFSSLWSSELECQRTLKIMLEGSDLSVVCRDLFFIRQVLCEIFSIFFVASRFGIVVERQSDSIDWRSVMELVSSSRYRRYLMDPRLMEYLRTCHYKSDPFGSRIMSPGSSFLHFLCRYDHSSLPSIIMEYHKANLLLGGTIHSQHRHETYGSPAHQYRIMHDIFANRDHSETFSRSCPVFVLLRDLFQRGEEYNGVSHVGGDDYGQPLSTPVR